MECEDCDRIDAKVWLISYTMGYSEELILCPTCRDEFAQADIVSSIQRR